MSELITTVCEDICQNPQFRQDFSLLTRNEMFPDFLEESEEQISRLLESSAILSLSTTEIHKKLAYKIAVYLLRQYRMQYKSVPFVTQLVLTRLGDLPVIEHMVNVKDAEDYFSFFSRSETIVSESKLNPAFFVEFPEVLTKKSFNQIQIGKGRPLSLTDFQSDVLRFLGTNFDVAFSAPTSAGKSYIILNFLAERLASVQDFCALYIVPTKALVAEVQADIIDRIKKLGVSNEGLIVFTAISVLSSEEIERTRKKVFVLTQERLQEMLANNELSFKVDLVVVDEAQQIAYDSRGIVIEDAVMELLRKDPSIQKVFVSPYVSNLDKFAKVFSLESNRFQTPLTRRSPVAQNFFMVNFVEKDDSGLCRIDVSVLSPELGTKSEIKLPYKFRMKTLPKTIYGKKAWVCSNLIDEGEPTLIYCNAPFDCRRVGQELASQSAQKEISQELQDSITFLREHVHREYYLADFLGSRIGYHYGTMPHFVRYHIKELFEQREIVHLACTSTLLEGVNLPAKNLVLYQPKRGRRIPMDSLSIRNLMGRAGRLRNDYYGKIFCINVEDWQSKDIFEDKQEKIESSSEVTLSRHSEDLIKYLSDFNFQPASEAVKSMATSLIMKQLMFPDRDFLSIYRQRNKDIQQETLNAIKSRLVEIASEISALDKNLILRNRSIDPRFQFELYKVLKTQSNNRILPPFPDRFDFYQKLQSIFKLISSHLLRESDRSFRHYSFLASEWIKEMPYKRILDKQINFELRSEQDISADEKKRKINKIIEELDDAIEDRIKFDYTRGLKCYCDLIAKLLTDENQQIEYCERLPLFLESGASSEKILFLTGAGLSRNTAVEIFERSGHGSWLPSWGSVTETIAWLRGNKPILKRRLHRVMFREIERLLG
jgi:hypothetical protein